MLKAVLDSVEGLSEEIKKEYKLDSDSGKYFLDLSEIETHPVVGPLVRAKNHEKDQRKALSGEKQALEDKILELTDELESVRKSKSSSKDDDAKVIALEKELKAMTEKSSALEKSVRDTIISSEALKIANDLSNSPSLLLPHISKRISAIEENGKWVAKVLDEDGEVSSLTIEELTKELTSNKEWAPILKGSKGSGSSAPDTKTIINDPADKPKDLSKANPQQLVEAIKAKRGEA